MSSVCVSWAELDHVADHVIAKARDALWRNLNNDRLGPALLPLAQAEPELVE